jgi:DNA-binding XRE family transcriptional regulator
MIDKLNKPNTEAAGHAHGSEDARPSEAERTNARLFDDVAQSLGLTGRESRARRWIFRIGTLLREARTHIDKGQEEIAERASVTQPYLSRLENGLLPKRGPTIDVLLRCAEAAECNIEIAFRSKRDGHL